MIVDTQKTKKRKPAYGSHITQANIGRVLDGVQYPPYQPYVPPPPASMRPGADDHKRYGSLQADGTVKPYTSPACAPCYHQPRVTGSQGKERFY